MIVTDLSKSFNPYPKTLQKSAEKVKKVCRDKEEKQEISKARKE